MAEHQVVEGDLLTVLPTLGVFDFIYADPPYGISHLSRPIDFGKMGVYQVPPDTSYDTFASEEDYTRFTCKWVRWVASCLSPGGSVVVSTTHHHLDTLLSELKGCGLKHLHNIVWLKTNAIPNMSAKLLMHTHEYLLWFSKGGGWYMDYHWLKSWNGGKQCRDVVSFPMTSESERVRVDGKMICRAQKPSALMEWIARGFTRPGSRLLEAFGGVGSFAVAVKNVGERSCVVVEKDPTRAAIIRGRLDPGGGEIG